MNLKKIISAILVVLFLLTTALPVLAEEADSGPNTASATPKTTTTTPDKTTTTKNVLGNNQNYSNNFNYIAQDSNYVYRRIHDVNSKDMDILLEKISKKDGAVKVLKKGNTPLVMTQLAVSSDYIFLLNQDTGADPTKYSVTYTITRMAKDGTGETVLAREKQITKFMILGDIIYYVGAEKRLEDGRLWQMDLDGKNKKILTKNDRYIHDIAYYNGNIIYVARQTFNIYNISSGSIQEILGETRWTRSIDGMGIQGDSLYYSSTSQDGPNELRKINLKTLSGPETIPTDFDVKSLTVDDKYFYWYDKASKKVLRANKAVGGKKEIITAQEVTMEFAICDGYVTGSIGYGATQYTSAYPKLYILK